MAVLIIILLLIAIPFVAALFLSKDYVIEREVTINKPAPEIFNVIKFLNNHKKFNKWTMQDPDVRTEFHGTDGTVGFLYAWESDNKNVGKGEQKIVVIEEGKRIDFDLHFIKPFENNAGSYMITEPISSDKTKVIWAFTGTRNYTGRIMHFLLNLKKMLGKDLQTSLNNLKAVMEN